MRNLVTSLIVHGRVQTTEAKAKEMRRFAERMITLGKQGDISARRRARSFVRTDAAVKKLFDDIAPRFTTRPGGYTRIIKLGTRQGDCAPMALIELTELQSLVAASDGDSAESAS